MWHEACHAAMSGEWAAICAAFCLQCLLFRSLYQRLNKGQEAASVALVDLQYAQRAQTIQAACHERERSEEEATLQSLLQDVATLELELDDTNDFIATMSARRDELVESVANMNKALENNIAETERCVAAFNQRADDLEVERLAIEDTIEEIRSECVTISERAATVSMERRALSSQRTAAASASRTPMRSLRDVSVNATTVRTSTAQETKGVARQRLPEIHVLVESEYQAAKKLNDFLLSETEHIWNEEVRGLIDKVTRNKDLIAALTVQMDVLRHRNDLALEAKQLLSDIRVMETANDPAATTTVTAATPSRN